MCSWLWSAGCASGESIWMQKLPSTAFFWGGEQVCGLQGKEGIWESRGQELQFCIFEYCTMSWVYLLMSLKWSLLVFKALDTYCQVTLRVHRKACLSTLSYLMTTTREECSQFTGYYELKREELPFFLLWATHVSFPFLSFFLNVKVAVTAISYNCIP